MLRRIVCNLFLRIEKELIYFFTSHLLGMRGRFKIAITFSYYIVTALVEQEPFIGIKFDFPWDCDQK